MAISFFRNKTISNNLYSLAGNAFQAGLGFATFLILVRVMDSQSFGKWVVFITVATLMDMFRLGLTGTATIRLISLGNQNDREKAMGASYQLSLLTSLLSVLIFLSLYALLPANEFSYVFLFYPLLALCNIPYYQASIALQGQSDFLRLSLLKLLNAGFIMLLLCLFIFLRGEVLLYELVLIYAGANLFTSLIAMVRQWDGARFIWQGDRNNRKEILSFGKYSTASYVGSNLLKSSDTLIIGLAPFMGVEAVAVYAIPFKFVEMIEVVLRSLASTAYPKLSLALKEKTEDFFKYLSTYILIGTLLFIPVSAVFILFPEQLLNLMGGNHYAQQIELQKTMLWIISVYILFLPADRFTGVALFAMNKARLNFYKIFLMLAFNILFDVLAVFAFKSLALVVLATLLFTLIGLIIGWKYVKRSMHKDQQVLNNSEAYSLYNIRQLMQWIRPQFQHRTK
ncbi:MAG: oligosaccharide flippase family protein [Carboxylicivirga sp.]|jgi:O-antigen/teichoic acid export membrane protein|nr:oligosaccharide flippase family protein [Carboxylicivirga sp.]